MTRRPPELHVHVERVVLHGVQPIPRDALARAIEGALAERLTPGAAVAPREPGAHIGGAVAPAVLSAIGIEGRR
jgi:hypothetical protein